MGISITPLKERETSAKDCLVFSTIQAFKGLESPVIVLTGFEEIVSSQRKSLLYVGMSRARSLLVLVLHEKIKKVIPELLKKKLSGEWEV